MRKVRMVLASITFALATQVATAADDSLITKVMTMKGIDSHWVVTFRDHQGKAMTREVFERTASNGGGFTFKDDAKAHTAEFILMTPDEVAKNNAKNHGETKSFKTGQPLPSFNLTTTDGKKFDNASLLGHTTLVNFFFADCIGCIIETPLLNAFAQKHPKQHVLAVTYDDADTAREYVAKRKFKWPVLAGGQALMDGLGIKAYPMIALVGPDGKLQKIITSGEIPKKSKEMTEADIQRWVSAP